MAAAPATTLPYSRKGETAPRALHSPLAVTIRYRIVHASRERWPVTRNPRAGIRESAWLRRHWTDVADVEHRASEFSELSQIAALAEAGREMRGSDPPLGGAPFSLPVPSLRIATAIAEPTAAAITATIPGRASGTSR